jgi:predicted DNA-binding ribbon-helix-helix protein
MKSPVIKRSIVIAGHKTSVSLEDAFWKGLKDIAVGRRTTLSDLVASIDSGRRHGNLSSAIRLFVLDHFQAHTDGPDGGHGDDHGDGPKSHRRLVAMGSVAEAPALRPE